MALLTKKEFSEKCGIKPNDLGTYVKRHKVILTGEHVDDSISENKEFLRKRVAKGKTIADPVPENNKVLPEVLKKSPANSDESKDLWNEIDESDEVFINGLSYQSLEQLNKELDAKKKTEEIAILKIKKDKLHGIVIPTDMVKVLFSQHTKSILVEFSNSVDKIITKISKRKSLNNNEVAEIRSELIGEINKAVDKSIDESKKNIKAVVDEFSEKRSKGDRT